MTSKDLDISFMKKALGEALKADKRLEVPVGAVIVHEGKVIGRGFNKRETGGDPTLHAEMIAIRSAAKKLGSWRLNGTTLYVTLEPCIMCMGAILQSRIPRLVFAAFDPKAGACGSVYDLSNDTRLNHRVHVTTGVLGQEAGNLLKDFFSKLRKKKREARKKEA